jgi:Skp family chaperone for outer membrane proteins
LAVRLSLAVDGPMSARYPPQALEAAAKTRERRNGGSPVKTAKPVLFLLTLILAGTCADPLLAQVAAVKAPNPAKSTKIGVVDMQAIMEQYWKAKLFRSELEEMLKQPRADAKKLMDEIEGWAREIKDKPGMLKPDRDARDDAIRKNKQILEDMNVDITRRIGKRSEDNLVVLWKDIDQVVQFLAKFDGFHLILGYGDPEKTDRGMFSSRSLMFPKMRAMDAGGAAPLYIHGSADVTAAILDSLNRTIPAHNQPAQK